MSVKKPKVQKRAGAQPGPCPPVAEWSHEQVSAISQNHSTAEKLYAIQTVYDWHIRGAGARAQSETTPAGWIATVRNALRMGWGLEGFGTNGSGARRPDPTGNRAAATALMEDMFDR